MSVLNILGALIIASPFIAIFVWGCYEEYLGWKVTTLIYLATGALVGLISAGVYLFEM